MLTRRGKIAIGILTAAIVVGTAVAVLALTGIGKHIPGIKNLTGGHEEQAKPAKCLSGARPSSGTVPDRPALAIKIENLPEARPQAGLGRADIVYEEPVEGGITRFIAIFQCEDAKRVGPVRSARLTDPPILLQFGQDTLFGFAGAAGPVRKAVDKSGLHDLSYDRPDSASAYERDSTHPAPHNLYTSTGALYRASHVQDSRPRQVFHYGGHVYRKAKDATTVHLDFSASADVFWRWSAKHKHWLRFHGTVPHTLEGGEQVSASNVVVMLVSLRDTGIVDAAGNPSPEVQTVGEGRAFVFRDGRMILGRWLRRSSTGVIKLTDPKNHPIQLQHGRTWVELFPKDRPVEAS
jgi:DUF3048 family protein